MHLLKIRKGRLNLSGKFKQYDLAYFMVYQILNGAKTWIIQSINQDFLAIQNPGLSMWIWQDPQIETTIQQNNIREWIDLVGQRSIPRLVGNPASLMPLAESYGSVHNFHCHSYSKLLVYVYNDLKTLFLPPDWTLVQPNMTHLNALSLLVGEMMDGKIPHIPAPTHVNTAKKWIKTGDVLLLEVKGEPVSMGRIAQRAHGKARITSIFTSEAHRNRGYARTMVTALAERILSEGFLPMGYVDEGNESAVRMYEKCGAQVADVLQVITLSGNSLKSFQ